MAKLSPEERRLLLNGASEPHLNPLDYTGTLAIALNYYNVQVDPKKKRSYAEAYAKKVLGLDVSAAPDYLLNTIGAMCRLITRNEPVSDVDVAKTHDGLTKIAAGKVLGVQAQTPKKDIVVKPKRDPMEVANELADVIISDIEYAIDDLVLKEGGGGSDFNVKSISIANAKTAKIVEEHVERRLASFEEARTTTDDYVKESYSHLNRRKLNHMVVLLGEVLQKVKQSVAAVKVKKVKPRKEKPAHVLVSKMKYKKNDAELNVTSVDPKEIVGASEVTVFNTKYRRVTIIRALEGEKLSVKGTTIINFDPTTTLCKTLRKPNEQLKLFINQTKRNTAQSFKSINSVEREGNTRINEDTLIIMVNK